MKSVVMRPLMVTTIMACLPVSHAVPAEILGFFLKQEATVPKGFPQPDPLGAIQLQHFPAYRLARGPSQGDTAFWRLFLHLRSSSPIEMAAPVELRFREAHRRYQQKVS